MIYWVSCKSICFVTTSNLHRPVARIFPRVVQRGARDHREKRSERGIENLSSFDMKTNNFSLNLMFNSVNSIFPEFNDFLEDYIFFII